MSENTMICQQISRPIPFAEKATLARADMMIVARQLDNMLVELEALAARMKRDVEILAACEQAKEGE